MYLYATDIVKWGVQASLYNLLRHMYLFILYIHISSDTDEETVEERL